MRIAKAASALVLLAAVGCGGPMILHFRGAEILNPKKDVTPPVNNPVDVKVFMLKDGGSFSNAVFDQLWGKYKEILGADLVGEPKQATIQAGRTKDMNLGEVPKDVRFIGVMAMYQQKAEGAPQQRHIAMAKEDADDVVFELVEYRLEVKKK